MWSISSIWPSIGLLDFGKGMVMDELIEINDSATLSEKERCFHLTITTIQNQMIAWPTTQDTILWNSRIKTLINKLIDVFDMEAK